MYPTTVMPNFKQPITCENLSSFLSKKINDEKDVIYFKQQSLAYKSILTYVDLLCERIHGSGSNVFNHKYTLKHETFKKCSEFIGKLEKICDETDLKLAQSTGSLRFGHVAYRDWFQAMRKLAKEFIDKDLAASCDIQFKEELVTYLSDSFGNKMRIDYGTGHELNFIIFTMGLSNLVEDPGGNSSISSGDSGSNRDKNSNFVITEDKLKAFIQNHGWDVLILFAHQYLRLCRRVQTKFRLEPAGSRGVYNMDDFQFLPFLFGAAQLSGVKYMPIKEFYLPDHVDRYKEDYMFFEAVDFILNNKRGPFYEHSYTLFGFTKLGSWENIYRRIRPKFTDDILGPFPIVQHLLFGEYILRWNSS